MPLKEVLLCAVPDRRGINHTMQGHVGKYEGRSGDGRSVGQSRTWKGMGEAEQAGLGECGIGELE